VPLGEEHNATINKGTIWLFTVTLSWHTEENK
jgi:hypothetical protein